MITTIMFIFFSKLFLNMWSPEQHSISFDGLAHLDCNYMDGETGWLGSMWSEIFSQIFPDCLTKSAVPFTGHLAPYNQLLILPLLLVSDAILHEMQKLGFWNFKTILFWINFSLVTTFFFLVVVICLSWYLHLKMRS